MKNLIAGFLIITAFAMTGFSQTETESAGTRDGREVFAMITKWADAVRSRDMKTLNSLFAEDLIITNFDGTTRGKKEELEILKPDAKVKTVSIKNDDVKVRVFGTAAVATALTKMHFVINEKDVHTAFRYTAVFVKQDGRWQLVALQTVRASQSQ
ncbi:MAG: nuclear transport factor 2 family protein [Acidobacteriota bacterium]|nr:nuclear transport factor 2 family protein [Acidobacteriota bacterium]